MFKASGCFLRGRGLVSGAQGSPATGKRQHSCPRSILHQSGYSGWSIHHLTFKGPPLSNGTSNTLPLPSLLLWEGQDKGTQILCWLSSNILIGLQGGKDDTDGLLGLRENWRWEEQMGNQRRLCTLRRSSDQFQGRLRARDPPH